MALCSIKPLLYYRQDEEVVVVMKCEANRGAGAKIRFVRLHV